MITSQTWRGKRYAVLGLARSGRATVEALLASGAEVVAWDEREEARAALAPLPEGRGDSPTGERGRASERRGSEHPHPTSDRSVALPAQPLIAGGNQTDHSLKGEGLSFADPLTLDLTGFAGVVVSPGVPLNRHPIAGHAAKFGVPVIGDIELFAQARGELPPHKVVGITGTNGKSTTTALVHHILKTAGVPTTMGGNIGLPILGQEPLPAGGVYVLELSSFQIDLTFTLDCDVAVLLNITPDHLDRYASFEAYAAAKARLFEMQRSSSSWIYTDDPESKRIAYDKGKIFPGDLIWVSTLPTEHPSFINVSNGIAKIGHHRIALQKSWPSLPGPHNAQNAACAVAVCHQLGIDPNLIGLSLKTYPGLPHRMERIREVNGVLFVNDSKATNPTSTAPGLAAYPAIHWILGGQAKTDELDACAPHFSHVRAAYTIGEAGPMFAALLRPYMAVTESGTLKNAVLQAADSAKPGETVLLSPACASFDQFRDYEDRGDQFRAAVEAL